MTVSALRYQHPGPFEPVEVTRENLAEIKALTGQELTQNEDGSVLVLVGSAAQLADGMGEPVQAFPGWSVCVGRGDDPNWAGRVWVSSDRVAETWH